MAYDPKQKDPAQQGQNQDDDSFSQITPPVTSSAPGSGPGSAVGKSSTPQSAPSQPFQNLSAYLTANAPQVQQQASNISNDLNAQYGQITNDINKGKTDFGTQVYKGYAAPNDDLVKSAASNPGQFASDPNNVKAFQSLYNDQYTGPSNFESSDIYGNLNSNVNKAVSNANQMTTFPGLKNYFQNRSPSATRGGNTLDTVLLQGNKDAYGNVIDSAKQFGNLNDYLSGSIAEANQGVTAAQKTAQDTSNSLRNKFAGEGGLIPSFQEDFNKRINTARNSALDTARENESFLAHLPLPNNAPANPQLLNSLGLTQDEFNQMVSNQRTLTGEYGNPFDFSNYATHQNPDVAIRPENFASADDYSKALAFSQLTGEDLSSFLNPGSSSMAGTAPGSIFNFDKSNALGDQTSALKNEDEKLAQSMLASPQSPYDPGSFEAGISPSNSFFNSASPNKKLSQVLNEAFTGGTVNGYDPLSPQAKDAKRLLNAVVRQGWFTPAPSKPTYGTDEFVDPNTGRTIA